MGIKKAKKATKPRRKLVCLPFVKLHRLEIVEGVKGMAIYLNGYRIAGPKPWGGGHVAERWEVTEEDFEKGLHG